ncbi:MAG TPA: hypothetical protein VFR37_09860 [Longimicrobium sp.]|nr:hypothetical protein [Longimicrobium sp.]
MIAKPMLGDWEIPRIEGIRTLERRDFVELPVPGRVGSVFQDLNSAPTRIAITGSLFGDEKRDEFLEAVRGQFREGLPVTFVADIVTATEVQHVIVDTLEFRENAHRPDETHYLIVLRESPPPPPPPDMLGGLDTGLLDMAAGFMDTITGALGALEGLGSIPDVGDPTPPITGALDGVTAATSGLDAAMGPLRGIFV